MGNPLGRPSMLCRLQDRSSTSPVDTRCSRLTSGKACLDQKPLNTRISSDRLRHAPKRFTLSCSLTCDLLCAVRNAHFLSRSMWFYDCDRTYTCLLSIARNDVPIQALRTRDSVIFRIIDSNCEQSEAPANSMRHVAQKSRVLAIDLVPLADN